MKVLIKIPSRGRPEALHRVMAEYEKLWSGNPATAFLISLDNDDLNMIGFSNKTKIPCTIVYGESKSKIDAINRDVAEANWDVLIVGSDDAVPKTQCWDEVIRGQFAQFQGTDGALWPNDLFNYRICCQPVIGRAYYNRFGYIYHPSYLSLYCDDEFTNVGKKLGLLKGAPTLQFEHLHYRNRKRQRDELDKKNEAHMKRDYELYRDRMRAHFPK